MACFPHKSLFDLSFCFIVACVTKCCNPLSSRQSQFMIRPLDLSVNCTWKIFVHVMMDLESNSNEALKLHYELF